MIKKLPVLLLSTSILAIAPVACVSCGYNVISIKGSTSMLNFLSDISKEIDKNKNEMNLEINVNGGGSGLGIGNLLDDLATFASISKDPVADLSEASKAKNRQKWIDKKIKTIKVAIEPLVFIIKVDESLMNNDDFYFDENNYGKILNAFGDAEELHLNDLLEHKLPEDHVLTPVYRSGGANMSGTAETFFKQHPYVKQGVKPNDKAAKFLNDCTGSGIPKVKLANDSNKEVAKTMQSLDTYAISFISYSYYKNNEAELKNSHIKLLKMKVDGKLENVVDKGIKNKKYTFERGFYLSFSLKKDIVKKLYFLKSFLPDGVAEVAYKNNDVIKPDSSAIGLINNNSLTSWEDKIEAVKIAIKNKQNVYELKDTDLAYIAPDKF